VKLRELINEPFALLVELEQRAKAVIAARAGSETTSEEWIGVAFRIGAQTFVASRADVREVLPAPEHVTRVPGAKTWLRGITNVRGQLLTVVDLKAFLGAGTTSTDRRARMLFLASREVPSAVLVDEVLGFRRFNDEDFLAESPDAEIRCERYLAGAYRRGNETFPLFDLKRLLNDASFLNAGALKAG
jgi:twitching motility protein PilI